MTNGRKRPRTSGTRDFLDTPMYRLVDRHRAILEKIRTREDAEYWGHMLIGEYYPEIPNSRGASGKLAALVGLTDYMDFYCTWGYYDLLKEGKTLEEAQMVLGERMARGIKEITRVLGQNRLRAGRCCCDSHRRDARRLRAARLSGSEIRGGGWIPHGEADAVGWICSRSSVGSDIRRCSTILPSAIRSTWTAVNVTRFPVAGIPWNAPVWVPWNRPTVTTWSPSATMLSLT